MSSESQKASAAKYAKTLKYAQAMVRYWTKKAAALSAAEGETE